MTENEAYELELKMNDLRNSIIDECIEVVRECELVEPNVRRIRLDEAVGGLVCLKVL